MVAINILFYLNGMRGAIAYHRLERMPTSALTIVNPPETSSHTDWADHPTEVIAGAHYWESGAGGKSCGACSRGNSQLCYSSESGRAL
jgi:hypothetical protein